MADVDILRFTGQRVECPRNNVSLKTDTILDQETERSYFMCDSCGGAHEL